jgi:hypothetical protein
MKRLILCNDGTWNTPDQEDNGIPAPTNVVKIYNSLVERDEANGIDQLKYYHPGVGTNGLLDSVGGGAIGVGVGNQLRSAYHWIATHYEPGDEIYIFGFSRGAFIARSLAGFLGRGLLNFKDVPSKQTWERVLTAYDKGYRKFRTPPNSPAVWAESDWAFFHEGGPTPVRFVGVWDTVGALGVPDDLELINLFDNSDAWRFHDTELGTHIQAARHAMAIDEMRASFTVTRWTNASSHNDAKEVWFPGVHSDVGGGYSNTDLSDGALKWMLDESTKAGLSFRPDINNHLKPNPLGCLHNSYKGAFAKLRSRPRSVAPLVAERHAEFHESAIERHVHSPIAYPAYCKTKILKIDEQCTVDIFADTRWNRTGLYLPAGHRFTFSADGEWKDNSEACDWKGTENSTPSFGDIIRLASSIIGTTENFMKKITQNASTDILGTKRVEELPWFTLVGAITNDSGLGAKVPNDGSPTPHQYANLPLYDLNNPLEITEPGYLFCFANDVWHLYHNNSGGIKLTIKRVG